MADIHARNVAVAVVRGDEPFVGEGVAVAFDVAAAENGSDDFGRSGVLGDEAVFGLAVEDEGFVEAGLHAVVDGDIPVFQRDAILFDFGFDRLFDGGEDGPGGAARGEGEGVGVGVDVGGEVLEEGVAVGLGEAGLGG